MDQDSRHEAFARRILQDALAEGTRRYWLRRAHQFTLVGTPACDEIAQACRNAATLAELHSPIHEFPALSTGE